MKKNKYYYTALISFRESYCKKGWINYRHYEKEYVVQEVEQKERPSSVYIPFLGKNKKVFDVDVEIFQKTKPATPDQLKIKLEKIKKQQQKWRDRRLRIEKRAEKIDRQNELKIYRKFKNDDEFKNLKATEFKKRIHERYPAIKNFNDEIKKELLSWDILNESPYSKSFYNSNNISWCSKPENSLRFSDHWNFYSRGSIHCQLATTDDYIQKWLLCWFKNGKYHVLKEFEQVED